MLEERMNVKSFSAEGERGNTLGVLSGMGRHDEGMLK